MCIVVDTNTLAPVFNASCGNHSEFKPVLAWIQSGRGTLVYGGTTYKNELRRATKYLKIVRLLRDSGKAVAIDDGVVDQLENHVIALAPKPGCDDQHVIALIGASSCPFVCSADKRSHKYLKSRKLYPKGVRVPKIYSARAHAAMLGRCSASVLSNVIG